jgi:hypothetical protein
MNNTSITALIEALPFAALVTDPELRLLCANPLASVVCDAKATGVSPNTILDIVPSEDHVHFQTAASTFAGKKKGEANAAPYTFSVNRSVPTKRDYRIVVTAVYHEDEAPSGLLFVCGDVATGLKDDTDAESDDVRMEVARQLAATLNHEINNPLFIVSATLEDMLSEVSDPAGQRRLNAALDAVWRVSSAVKQLSEIRRLVSTAYIDGLPMIDLEASQERP